MSLAIKRYNKDGQEYYEKPPFKIYAEDGTLVGSTDRHPATVFVAMTGDPQHPKYHMEDGNGMKILDGKDESDAIKAEQLKLTKRLAELAALTKTSDLPVENTQNIVKEDTPTGPREVALSDEDLAKKAVDEKVARDKSEEISKQNTKPVVESLPAKTAL